MTPDKMVEKMTACVCTFLQTSRMGSVIVCEPSDGS